MTNKLPKVNAFGYYEIRLESIGGLGANLSGKILGELGALYLDLNSSNFSSYGSEKRGSPVKAYIRYTEKDQEILLNSPVERPHLLGLFHENLAGKIPVMAGVSSETAVVVNTAKEPEIMRDRLQMCAGTLYCVDALKIAMECKTRVNMVMLGTLAKASGFISLEQIEEAIQNTIGRKYPAALEGNLEGLRRGYEEFTQKVFQDDGSYPYVPYKEVTREWGYDNAPIGGVVPHIGSTVSNDLQASREGYLPIFKAESCIHCGLCDSTCPDMVFQFVEGTFKGKPTMVNKGPDYHHCKGCLRCVEICPTDALTKGTEWEHDFMKQHVRNKDLIVDRLEFEDVGASSWVESESAAVSDYEV